MVDRLTSVQRSALMSKVKGKNTLPELAVRKIVHGLGFRFSLHRRDLPGSPDVVLPRLKSAIFVHGCFWHRHANCQKASMPKTRRAYWDAKFVANVSRDAMNLRDLRKSGWRALVVWQCELKKPSKLKLRLSRFLQTRP